MTYKEEFQKKKAKKLSDIYEKYDVPEYIREFFENNLSSENAKLQYWTTIKRFLEWCIKNKYIDKPEIKDIDFDDLKKLKTIVFTRYFDGLKRRNIKLSTINTKIKQLKSFFKYLSYNDYIEKDYIQGISKRKYRLKNESIIKESKLPEDEEIDFLINELKKKTDVFLRERNLAIIELLLNSGLRESELVGLDITDLYFNRQRPYLRVIGKGAYSKEEYRKVYLNKYIVNVIKHWLDIRLPIADMDEKGVFIGRNGKRLSEQSVYQICMKNSYERITPHMLRHYYGTKLYEETNDLVYVKEQLGHESIDTTGNTYVSGYTKL